MNAAWQFVIYLLALIVFTLVAVWPVVRRQPYTPVHVVSLGLALLTVVPLATAAQATF